MECLAGYRAFRRVFLNLNWPFLSSTAGCPSSSFVRLNIVFHYIHCALLIHRKLLVVWIALTRNTRACHHDFFLWIFHWDEKVFQCHITQFSSEWGMGAERIPIMKPPKCHILWGLLTIETNCFPKLCILWHVLFHHIKTTIIQVYHYYCYFWDSPLCTGPRVFHSPVLLGIRAFVPFPGLWIYLNKVKILLKYKTYLR